MLNNSGHVPVPGCYQKLHKEVNVKNISVLCVQKWGVAKNCVVYKIQLALQFLHLRLN